MAIHTPCSPSVGASQAARVRRTAQMLNKFIRHGISVSAAPTKTPYATIEAANIGSAKASMRKAITPQLTDFLHRSHHPDNLRSKQIHKDTHYAHDGHSHQYGNMGKATGQLLPSGSDALTYKSGGRIRVSGKSEKS